MEPTLILAVETHRHKSIGTYLRCASAFGASIVIVVGSPLYSTHGAHGAQNHVQVVHFYYWSECIDFCRSKGCAIYAISPISLQLEGREKEKSDETRASTSIDTYQFHNQSACFIVGEKDGLSDEQIRIADSVLHVEVPYSAFADKVMYDAKVAICLQQFAIATHLTPRSFTNEKHDLGEVDFRRPKTIKAGRSSARQAEHSEEAGLEEPLDNLFS